MQYKNWSTKLVSCRELFLSVVIPNIKIAFCFHALNNRKKMLQVSGSRYWISFFHTDSCKSTDCVNFALQFRKQNRVNWIRIYITTCVSLCKIYGGVNRRLELEMASPFFCWPVNHECHVKQLNLFAEELLTPW